MDPSSNEETPKKSRNSKWRDKGAFKYYISTFLRILNPPPPLHQRNQRGSRPPTPLYFADVILEHIVRVLILFRGLFLKIFSEVSFFILMMIFVPKTIIKIIGDLDPR